VRLKDDLRQLITDGEEHMYFEESESEFSRTARKYPLHEAREDIYTANPAAEEGWGTPVLQAPKAMTVFVKLFVITRLSPPCVVSYGAHFHFGMIFCAVRQDN
jgi:hypothetical protein